MLVANPARVGQSPTQALGLRPWLLAAAACRGSRGRCDPRPPLPRAPLGCWWGAACMAMARGPRPLPCFPPLVVPSFSQAGLLLVVPTRSKRPVLKGLPGLRLPSCLARALRPLPRSPSPVLPQFSQAGLGVSPRAVARGLVLILRGEARSHSKRRGSC